MRIELGAGRHPTPGYIHNDMNAFPDIELVGNPWEILAGDSTVDEVLALGVIEHLTYAQVSMTIKNVHRMLRYGGVFYFDVPDIVIWCRYVTEYFAGLVIPFSIEHVLSTLYGWQRWEGDEHKSGWYLEKLVGVLEDAGFTDTKYGVQHMYDKGLYRNRFMRPLDAHIYCLATK